MRLDFTLYGLAAVLFGVSVAVFFVMQNDLQIVLTLSTALIGLVFAAGGYIMRPKLQITAQPIKPIPTVQSAPEPIPEITKPTVVEAPPVIAEQKVETPAASEPVAESTKSVKTPEETKMLSDKAKTETPVLSAPEQEPQLSAPAEVPILAPPSNEVTSDLAQIRGINSARIEQLKSNGITSIRELAQASPDELATKLGVSPKIVKMWVGSAKKKAI